MPGRYHRPTTGRICIARRVTHAAFQQKSELPTPASVTVNIELRFVLVWSLAACSFEHGIPLGGGNGNTDAASDTGGPVVVDAPPIDAKPDAPPGCADADGDGICNSVDDWPCGAKPTTPSATVTMSGNNNKTTIDISAVNLANTTRMAVAAATANVTLDFDYDISDTACPGNCVDQIEMGWVTGSRSGCPFDGVVSKQNGASGSIQTMI